MFFLRKYAEEILLLLLLLAFFGWFGLPIITAGSDNMRLVDAFNVDEAVHLELIRTTNHEKVAEQVSENQTYADRLYSEAEG